MEKDTKGGKANKCKEGKYYERKDKAKITYIKSKKLGHFIVFSIFILHLGAINHIVRNIVVFKDCQLVLDGNKCLDFLYDAIDMLGTKKNIILIISMLYLKL